MTSMNTASMNITNDIVASLQQQCRELQQSLEEKDERMFELSATLVTVQAEAQHQVKQVQQETSLEIQKYQEALRRTEREASLLHHQLSKVTTGTTAVQPQQAETPVAAASAVTSAINAPAAANSTTSPNLAHYLLQSTLQTTQTPPSCIVLAAASTTAPHNDVSLVWQLTQHCLLHDSDWTWWNHAVTFSAQARRTIRDCNCTPSTIPRKSRIQTTCSQDVHAIASSLRESVTMNVTTPSATTTTPYVQDLLQRLWHKFTSSTMYLQCIQIVLMDASPQECTALAWNPFCTLRIVDLIHVYTQQSLPSNIPAGLRLEYSSPINDEPMERNVDIATLCMALQVLKTCWPRDNDKSTSLDSSTWARRTMGLLLDLLEFVILPNMPHQHHQELACCVLQVLQHWNLTPNPWMYTMFGLENNKHACTGMGIVVRLWSHVDSCSPVAAECVKLLHLILWHTRRQRERQSNTDAATFQSLLVEYSQFHKAACTSMVVDETVSKSLRTMAAMQLQEIALDEEDLQDLHRELSAQQHQHK